YSLCWEWVCTGIRVSIKITLLPIFCTFSFPASLIVKISSYLIPYSYRHVISFVKADIVSQSSGKRIEDEYNI
ncbi:hypothetical protein, partial [Pantoea eucalypti]|uniref:hypothetical protein n=1 Tax=Pantoea eucalypti TaxID=470933 RepID=UPI00289FAF99